MLLSPKKDTVKLADFSGSSIDESPWTATVDYEYWSKLPGSDKPSQTADLFALGSTIYEMATGSPPYENKSWREVHGLYKRSKFPDVSAIRHLGPVILKCWKQEYKTADEIVYDLESNSKLGLIRRDSNTFEDSYVVEPSSSKKACKQPAATYKYVDLANDSGRKSKKQELDTERIYEKTSHREERTRKDDRGSKSFFARSLSWLKPSYSYQIKVN
jgi:serine/threonine protein kinase